MTWNNVYFLTIINSFIRSTITDIVDYKPLVDLLSIPCCTLSTTLLVAMVVIVAGEVTGLWGDGSVVVVVDFIVSSTSWWHWHGLVSISPPEPWSWPPRPIGRQGSIVLIRRPRPESSLHWRVLIWSYCGEHGEHVDQGPQEPQPTLRWGVEWIADTVEVVSCWPLLGAAGEGKLGNVGVSTNTSANL